MRREYLDSMKADGLGEFVAACEDLKNCKFIIAENKIALLLKAIADNRQLYSIFGAALYGFDYRSAFSECVGDNSFTLPSDPKTAIALVFRILMDMDSGKMPLRNFLEAYFYSESLNESYARFGLEIIAPFETYCRMASIAPSSPSAAPEPQVTEEKMARQYDEVNDKYYNDLKTDAVGCVAALLEHADKKITAVIDRAEFNACVKGLIDSIKANNSDRVISSFLGVKYAVSYFFKSDPEVNEVYKKLEYDIKRLAN